MAHFFPNSKRKSPRLMDYPFPSLGVTVPPPPSLPCRGSFQSPVLVTSTITGAAAVLAAVCRLLGYSYRAPDGHGACRPPPTPAPSPPGRGGTRGRAPPHYTLVKAMCAAHYSITGTTSPSPPRAQFAPRHAAATVRSVRVAPRGCGCKLSSRSTVAAASATTSLFANWQKTMR